MKLKNNLICDRCNGTHFELKREATYLYTYKIVPPQNAVSETKNKVLDCELGDGSGEEGLPFLFDNREKTNSHEYLLCMDCGKSFPCKLNEGTKEVQLTILQKAVRADHVDVGNPEFIG